MIPTTVCLSATLDRTGDIRGMRGSWAASLRDRVVQLSADDPRWVAQADTDTARVARVIQACIGLGFSLQDADPPATVEMEATRLAQLPPGQTMHHLPDGSWMTTTLDAHPDGQFSLLVAMAHPPIVGASDMTEILHPLLDAMPSAVSIKDADRRYLFANPAWASFYGVDRDAIVGRRFEDMDHTNVCHDTVQALVANVRARDDQVLAKGHPVVDIEEVSIDRDDRRRVWSNSRIPLGDHVLGTAALLSITHDITVMREAELAMADAKRKAEEANQAKSEFISIVTHELRTPLNAVVGFAEICLQMTDDPQMTEYLQIIESSGKSLGQLIEDLLDLSRIESGRFALEDGAVDVAAEIHNVVRMMEPNAREKGLMLVASVDPNMPPRVRGDRRRINQIIVNLVGNALKFTASGSITISAKLDGERLTVAVTDTGQGIDEGDQGRIFEPFTQVSGGEARRSAGLGLGLAICKRLVHQMRGHIGVDSTPGDGSRFWFDIPIDLSETRALAKPAPRAETPALRLVKT